jgi:hypothetical protein
MTYERPFAIEDAVAPAATGLLIENTLVVTVIVHLFVRNARWPWLQKIPGCLRVRANGREIRNEVGEVAVEGIQGEGDYPIQR